MDISPVLESALKLFVTFFSIRFKVFGYTVSVASCIVFTALASTVIWFIRRLDD